VRTLFAIHESPNAHCKRPPQLLAEIVRVGENHKEAAKEGGPKGRILPKAMGVISQATSMPFHRPWPSDVPRFTDKSTNSGYGGRSSAVPVCKRETGSRSINLQAPGDRPQ
jgi:hypothetical protein